MPWTNHFPPNLQTWPQVLHAADFNYAGPIHHTCPLDTSRDALLKGDSSLRCLQRCTAPQGLPVRTGVTIEAVLELQVAA